jgi:hypothetical protein
MHAILLMAALAVGSGDGRDGATDARTVDKTPPYARLRVGMALDDALKPLERESTSSDWLCFRGRTVMIYRFGPDEFGRYHPVIMEAQDDRLAICEVESSTTSNLKK